jgi:hypothetical protein
MATAAGRGRESFSERVPAKWFVVARKRLPTPFALRTAKPNPTVIVLPVLPQNVRQSEGQQRSGEACREPAFGEGLSAASTGQRDRFRPPKTTRDDPAQRTFATTDFPRCSRFSLGASSIFPPPLRVRAEVNHPLGDFSRDEELTPRPRLPLRETSPGAWSLCPTLS